MASTELLKSVLKDSSSLKAYYRMESGALTTDSSGNGKTLTNTGTAGEGTGVFGGAVDFGATNTTKCLNGAYDFGNSGGAVSVSLWIKMNTEITTGSQRILELDSATENIIFGIEYEYNAGARRLKINRNKWGTADNSFYYTVALGTTSWHHIVISYDATTLRGFFDGNYVGSVASSGNGASALSDFIVFGANGGLSSLWLSALIDDIAIFSKAISADEVKELYEGRSVGELWPQANLSALYHLNGSSTDYSGNNRHGTDTSVTYSGANGKFIQGASFNGSSSKISLATIPHTGTGAFSIIYWSNTSVTGTRKDAVSYGSATTTQGVFAYIQNTNYYQFDLSGVSGPSGTTVVTDGLWHMYAATYDGAGNMKIYTDGRLEDTHAGASPNIAAGGQFIGVSTPGGASNYFSGKLDEVAIYTRALSDNEIRMLYAKQTGKFK